MTRFMEAKSLFEAVTTRLLVGLSDVTLTSPWKSAAAPAGVAALVLARVAVLRLLAVVGLPEANDESVEARSSALA